MNNFHVLQPKETRISEAQETSVKPKKIGLSAFDQVISTIYNTDNPAKTSDAGYITWEGKAVPTDGSAGIRISQPYPSDPDIHWPDDDDDQGEAAVDCGDDLTSNWHPNMVKDLKKSFSPEMTDQQPVSKKVEIIEPKYNDAPAVKYIVDSLLPSAEEGHGDVEVSGDDFPPSFNGVKTIRAAVDLPTFSLRSGTATPVSRRISLRGK
ncbi:MAG: hypothetical protein JW782_02035 [Candidatus Saganbacteria bacterium]|nr:hypothetical protein [Candidatus Saganbacteria bacterium]